MEVEIFRNIPKYQGLYQVSNLGRIKSFHKSKERILNPRLNNKGYLRVDLYSKTIETRAVHQLVAIAFLNHNPNKIKKRIVDHKNNIKTDNRLENLQVITQRENCSKDKKGYTSQYVGVYWRHQRNRWVSKIHINGKQKYLGSFIDELEASKSYQKALNRLQK